MKKIFLVSFLLVIALLVIEQTTNVTASLQHTMSTYLQAAQQQGTLTFPQHTTATPAPTATATEITEVPTVVPFSITLTPTIQVRGMGLSQTRQVDWVYDGQGVCWSAWAGNQCTLQSHEGGASTVARDINNDGTSDISCSQGDGTNQTTTVTNTSDQPITLSCERYECNQCASGNGTHAQCDGSIDQNAIRISEPIVVEPGCSLTCSFAGVVGNCSDEPAPTSSPSPTTTPTPQITFPATTTPTPTATTILSPTSLPGSTVTPTANPTNSVSQTPTAAPTQPATHQKETAQVRAMLNSLSIHTIRTIIENLTDDDDIQGTDTTQTRYAGTDGNGTEAAYIKAQLESYGLTVTEQPFDQVSSVMTGFTCPKGTEMTNIVARIEGTSPNETYMLVGHYDSISEEADFDPAPGADDNASGTAAILEVARVLATSHAQNPFKNSVEIVLFDGEELGLCGSSHYVLQMDTAKKNTVKGVFNLDMIGTTVNGQTCSLAQFSATDVRSRRLAEHLTTMNVHYGLTTTGAASSSTNYPSDQLSFQNNNIPSLLLTECYPRQNVNYHRTTDIPAHLNYAQIEQLSQSVIATFGELALGVPFRNPNPQDPPTNPTPTTQGPRTPTPTGQAQRPTSTPSPQGDTTQFEREAIEAHNRVRAQHGVPPLQKKDIFTQAAQAHADDMDNRDYISHDQPGGLTGVQRILKIPGAIGENIASGSSNGDSAVQFWMNSKTGHRDQVLSTIHTHVGCGVAGGIAVCIYGR